MTGLLFVILILTRAVVGLQLPAANEKRGMYLVA